CSPWRSRPRWPESSSLRGPGASRRAASPAEPSGPPTRVPQSLSSGACATSPSPRPSRSSPATAGCRTSTACSSRSSPAPSWYRPPKGWVTAVYITLGWVAVIGVPQLWTSLGVVGFLLIFFGGVSYTVGAVIHAARRPDPWPEIFGYHELFHVFVLVALVLHFAAIAFVVLPKG